MQTEAANRDKEGLSAKQVEAVLEALASVKPDGANLDLYAVLLRLTLIEQKLDFVLSEMKASNEPKASDIEKIGNAARGASTTKGLLIIGGLLLAVVLLF